MPTPADELAEFLEEVSRVAEEAEPYVAAAERAEKAMFPLPYMRTSDSANE